MGRTATASTLPTTRSRVSNGSQPFLAADGRSAAARLLKDREAEFARPLGGLSALTLAERSKVEAAAVLSVRLETARSAVARGEQCATDEDLIRLTNGLSRALGALDKLVQAKAKARKAAPSLAEYLAGKQAEPAA